MAKVGIIGGGVIGLFSAYYLHKRGHEVSILDKSLLTDGCSHGNAGMIVPSHIIPLSAPGVVYKGLKWLLDKKSPFAIKPSLDKDLLYWLYLFNRSATTAKVAQAVPALSALSTLSKQLYQSLAAADDFALNLTEKGILMLCKNKATLSDEQGVAELANRHGISTTLLSPDELAAFDPGVQYAVRGAIHYPGDAILNPADTIRALMNYLTDAGVTVITDCEVNAVQNAGHSIQSIHTSQGLQHFDHYLFCGGVWTSSLIRSIGIRLPLTGGKGYSFMLNNHAGLHIPALLLDHKVSVTPFGSAVRFGGTMELGPLLNTINPHKVQGIYAAIRAYYPDWQGSPPSTESVWYGFRPCSPDGLPYLGKLNPYDNAWVSAGHGMMGVSLAPASGHLLAAMIDDDSPPMELSLFHPNRFD
jgi:D-amino-acid dehydrogenase